MAKLKIEVKANFSVIENEETKPDTKFENQIKEKSLDLSELALEITMSPDPNKPKMDMVGFKCSKDKMKSGKLNFSHNQNRIDIECDAVFELDVRDQYVAGVKSNNMIWLYSLLNKIDGPYDVIGLDQLVYTYFNKRLEKEMTEIYYKIEVKSI